MGGCVIRGYIRKRGETSWLIAIYLGKDKNSEKKYYYETVKGNKRDAEKRAAELINQIHNHTFVKPAKITVAEFLDRWLKSHAKNSLRPAT